MDTKMFYPAMSIFLSYLWFLVLLQVHPRCLISFSFFLPLSQTFPFLSLSLSFPLAACEKLHLLFSVQARTRPRKKKKPIVIMLTQNWTDHTPACTEAHVVNTHTPEPHLTRWVVQNSPDFTSLNSAAICNKVEKGVLFNRGLKE